MTFVTKCFALPQSLFKHTATAATTTSRKRFFSATAIVPNEVDCYISTINDAYTNLAIEEWLLRVTQPDRYILYLWRNKPCVVVGRNQNPFSECNLRFMDEHNIPLVRRRSGGGAVYHVRSFCQKVLKARKKKEGWHSIIFSPDCRIWAILYIQFSCHVRHLVVKPMLN